MKKIHELLNSSTYNFLREDEHLNDNIMLLTIGGSYSYGTNVEGSDVDIRGVTGELKRDLIGLSNFEQFEDKHTDTVIYGFRKIVNLMINTNPNTIEIMGTKPEQIFYISQEGQMLKDNIGLFLSKRAAHSFGGYAHQQLRRLQNALARDSYPQAEKEKHILGTINNQLYALQENYAKFSGDNLNLYLDTSIKDNIEQEIFFDVNFKHYPLRDFRNIYCDMDNVLRMYEKLGQRNSKKDEPHLLKHAMHLARLFLMGIEILTTGKVNTYRENDKDFLLDIRNGKYSYDEIFAMVDKYTIDFEYAKNNTVLPDSPDLKKIEELVITINERLLQK